LVPGACQQPVAADHRHRRTPRAGPSGLSRKPARQADVRPGRLRRGGLAHRAAARGRRTTLSRGEDRGGRRPMTTSLDRPTRRGLLGLLLNGIIGVALAVPILRYLFSPVSRDRKPGSRAWVPLGRVEDFPAGETRYATYRSPVVMPSDGDTANIGCWVRNV